MVCVHLVGAFSVGKLSDALTLLKQGEESSTCHDDIRLSAPIYRGGDIYSFSHRLGTIVLSPCRYFNAIAPIT